MKFNKRKQLPRRLNSLIADAFSARFYKIDPLLATNMHKKLGIELEFLYDEIFKRIMREL
jgi:hypothetical protein